MDGLGRELGRCFGLGQLLVARSGDHAAQELDQARCPGVDDPGLAQHVELLPRASDRRVAAGNDGVEQLDRAGWRG